MPFGTGGIMIQRSIFLLILVTVCLFSLTVQAFPIKMGVGPDNNLGLLIQFIESAQKELLMNIYEINSSEISKALIGRIEAGVTVKLLVEGTLATGGISQQEEDELDSIQAAMESARNHDSKIFMMVTPQNGKEKRRFRFDHAKYLVADSASAYVTSENFSVTGHAKAGHVGNRGWDVVIDEQEMGAQLSQLFMGDTDLSYGDIIVRPIGAGRALHKKAFENHVVSLESSAVEPKSGKNRSLPAIKQGEGSGVSARLILSPNSRQGLIDVIRSAQAHLEMETMSLPSVWRDPELTQSVIVTELINAAKRGVKVRVLLNDARAFAKPKTGFGNAQENGKSGCSGCGFVLPGLPGYLPGYLPWYPWPELGLKNSESPEDPDNQEPQVAADKYPNLTTAKLLEKAARCEHLPISAKIVSVKEVQITVIHNKGVLVDGIKGLVSSINGTRNSVMNNREVAVLLESKDAATYFGNAFDFDWNHSPELSGIDQESCGH